VSTPSDSESSSRKARHLEICVDPEGRPIEGRGGGWEGLAFVHKALPELDSKSIDTSLDFLGHRIALPLMISCMTGGSEGGGRVNRALAEAAQAARIPVGIGSMRILMREEGLFPQFHIKPYAPDVPVIANLGAVQLRESGAALVVETARRLEAQALAIHLNAGQELFQAEGDRDFRGLKEAIARLCEASPLPVIVKETGFGIGPAEARWLLEAGAAFVDLAAAGGTNWILVESYRLPPEEAAAARDFADWGLPAALLLLAFSKQTAAAGNVPARGGSGSGSRIIASGGLRSGVELAKALALGAELGGIALPFARAAYEGGSEGALRLIRSLELSLRAAMTMTGSPDLAALRSAPLRIDPALLASAEELLRAEGSGR
jgi:isopentenyl-diphosphate delta-isomerase type 2